MKFIDYIKSLIPFIKKDDLLEGLAILRSLTNDVTLPMVRIAVGMANKDKGIKTSNKDYDFAMNKTLTTINKYHVKGQGFDYILNSLTNISKNLELVEKILTEDTKSDEIVREGITYKKASLLQYIESSNFVVNMTRTIIRVYFSLLEGDADIPEVKNISQGIANYTLYISSINMDTKTFNKLINDIPELSIPADGGMVGVSGAANSFFTAPLAKAKGLFSFEARDGYFYNFIFAIRKWIADIYIERYNVAKDELELVKRQVLYLERKRNGQEDPQLEREIEYQKSRIQKLEYKIEQIEAKYAN